MLDSPLSTAAPAAEPIAHPPDPTPAAPAPAPTFTYKVSEAHLEVEVTQTHRAGDDFYKLGGSLELPLDPAGRYDVTQLEGAMASLTIVAARIEGMVSQAWLVKQETLRAERARAAMTAQLSAAMQSICVPPTEMQAALVEFFGGVPASPVDCRTTLAKITAMRSAADRPAGWRWGVPTLPKKTVLPARRPVTPGGKAAAPQAAANAAGSAVTATGPGQS
jgi:hypothetical protein